MEYVLVGAAGWLGASLLAGAGWVLFHIDVRAREERARTLRADRRRPSLADVEERQTMELPGRQVA